MNTILLIYLLNKVIQHSTFLLEKIWTFRLINSIKVVITVRCFNQWDDNREWVWVALSCMRNISFVCHHQSLVFDHHTGLWKCHAPIKIDFWGPQKELSAHWSGKGYKTFSEDVGLHQSTVRQIFYKWRKFNTIVTLSRSGRPTIFTPRARCTIIQFTKNHKVMLKDLQAPCFG